MFIGNVKYTFCNRLQQQAKSLPLPIYMLLLFYTDWL